MTDPRAAAAPAYAWWMDAADVEYRRIIDLLGRLEDDDWHRATACDDWDVRAVVAHLLGAAEAMASPRETCTSSAWPWADGGVAGCSSTPSTRSRCASGRT